MKAAMEGRLTADPSSAASAEHVAILKPAVQELTELETQAQCTFLSTGTQHKWRQMLQ